MMFTRTSGTTAAFRALGSVIPRFRSFATQPTVAAPISAAAIRGLDVKGVIKFVEMLHVSPAQAEKLREQEIDGAALLETSVNELCDRYGLSGGAAHTIMRSIAPAVAEVQAAAVAAQSVELTIFPPKEKKKNNPYKMTLTPELFLRSFSSQAPLRLLNSSGSFLRVVASLEEAVEGQKKGMFLHASRSYDNDLTDLLGFSTNCATSLEIKSTLALAGNENLRTQYGKLELVNEGQVVELTRLSCGSEKQQQLQLAPDGLVVSDQTSDVVLFNSAKHTPSVAHLAKLLESVSTLEEMLADWANVRTDPPEAKSQLRGSLRVVPFLSGDNFSMAVVAECLRQGIGIVRPSGEGFIVKAAANRAELGVKCEATLEGQSP